MTLYEMDNEILDQLDEFINEFGEPDYENKAFDKWEKLGKDRKKKILNIGYYIKNLSAEKKAHLDEAEIQGKKANSIQNKINGLEYLLKRSLKPNENSKNPISDTNVKIYKSVSKRTRFDGDISNLPPWLVKVSQTPILGEIRKELDKGEKIDKAYIETTEVINIK